MGQRAKPSILDQARDVVLFTDCHAARHLFRDDQSDGLILTPTADGWTLTHETYTHTIIDNGESWTLLPDATPICAAAWNPHRSQISARHLPTGRVILRDSSQYRLMARAARFYLRKAQ
jgi:hypothetical protein